MLSCWCLYCSSLPEEPQQSVRWMLNVPCVLFLQLILFCSTLHPGLSGLTHGPSRLLWNPPPPQGRVWGEPQFTFNDHLMLWLIKEKQITSSIVIDWRWRKSADASARQTITAQVCPLYPPRAGQRKWWGWGWVGEVYDVIKKCQKRSAWEQVVCGAAAIKDSCSLHSLPQMVTPQTEHCWLGTHMDTARTTNIHVFFFPSSRTKDTNFMSLQNCRELFWKMPDNYLVMVIRITTWAERFW